jgi:hypothetical protein
MFFVHFLMNTPVVAFLLLLVPLVTVVPFVTRRLSRRKTAHSETVSTPAKEPPTTRFLGIEMDIAILIFGLFLVLGAIGWMHKTFFR